MRINRKLSSSSQSAHEKIELVEDSSCEALFEPEEIEIIRHRCSSPIWIIRLKPHMNLGLWCPECRRLVSMWEIEKETKVD